MLIDQQANSRARPRLGDWGSRVQISALRPKNPHEMGIFDTLSLFCFNTKREQKSQKSPRMAQKVPEKVPD